MTKDTKKRLFKVCFGVAGLLYLWSIYTIWAGPGMSAQMYFGLAVLPAVVGVGCLATALGLHMDLRAEDDESG